MIGIIKLFVSSALNREKLTLKLNNIFIIDFSKKRILFSGSTGKINYIIIERNIKLIKIDGRSNRQDPRKNNRYQNRNQITLLTTVQKKSCSVKVNKEKYQTVKAHRIKVLN